MKKIASATVSLILLVLLPSAVLAQDVIDFEKLPNGSSPTDDADASQAYKDSHGIEFRANGKKPSFEAHGKSTLDTIHGFKNDALQEPDMEADAFVGELGKFFLKTSPDDPDLEIIYLRNQPLSASGVIWDIDGKEEWEVQAFDADNAAVGSLLTATISDGGDGAPWEWTVKSTTSPISRIEIRHVGDARPGLGFDKFTARLQPGPCNDICCIGACCFGDRCVATTEAHCSKRDGVFHGAGSSCEVGQCVADGICFPTSKSNCKIIGGRYLGSAPCPSGNMD